MRIGRIVPVALSVVSLVTAPVAAQAADRSPIVPTRVASKADNPEHFSKNILLVIALLAITVGVIFLVRGHKGGPASP